MEFPQVCVLFLASQCFLSRIQSLEVLRHMSAVSHSKEASAQQAKIARGTGLQEKQAPELVGWKKRQVNEQLPESSQLTKVAWFVCVHRSHSIFKKKPDSDWNAFTTGLYSDSELYPHYAKIELLQFRYFVLILE